MKAFLSFKSVLLSLLIVWKANSLLTNDVVQTSSGPIRGTEITFDGKRMKQYLGIPFAKPPVGDLRFKKPEPVEPWKNTLVADSMPPACIQYIEYPFPWYDAEDGKSEDCLYLNIWAPSDFILTRKRPVIFWIYGGGFTLGSNRKRVYEGQALAAGGDDDVVVVTINYRMAAFGFLTSETESAPGNVGMYDMLEALKWVNKNIGAFGGNPDLITLAGQSAGSIAIGYLCVSPLTKGLFKRVIMESGSPAFLLADNNTVNIEQSQKLAEAVGCADGGNTIYDNPEEVVECLRGVDAVEIAKTLNSFHPTSARSFFPNFGDEILPKNARMAIINGDFHNADVLIGNNRDEGAFQITTGNPDVFGFFGEKDTKVNKSYGESLLQKTFKDFKDPDAVIQHYLGDVDDSDYDLIRERVYTAMGDYSLLCPTVYFAESYSKAGNDVYYYFFVHRPSTTPWADWMGVVHFEEVQFVFGLPLQVPQNYTSAERSLSKRMVDIWTHFAKTGRPGRIDLSSGNENRQQTQNNGDGKVLLDAIRSAVGKFLPRNSDTWPKYSREDPKLVELDTIFVQGEGPHKDHCDFFRGYFGFN